MKNIILELKVHNHSGVMSHITGLFSRRSFNLEGILCGPLDDAAFSRIYLLVNENNTLCQIKSQLEKLYDVVEITVHENYNTDVFRNIGKLFNNDSEP